MKEKEGEGEDKKDRGVGRRGGKGERRRRDDAADQGAGGKTEKKRKDGEREERKEYHYDGS